MYSCMTVLSLLTVEKNVRISLLDCASYSRTSLECSKEMQRSNKTS